MAIYTNSTFKGKINSTKDGLAVFSGKNSDGQSVIIRLTSDEKDAKGIRKSISMDNLRNELKSSIEDSVAVYIEKNKSLSPEQIQMLRNNVESEVESILSGKESVLNFSSVSGFYRKEQNTYLLEGAVISKESEKGVFHSLKLTEFKKLFGRDTMPIEVEFKYKSSNGYSKRLKIGNVGDIDPENIMLIGKPIKSFSEQKDVSYLFQLNKDSILFNRDAILKRGENPTFQNPHFQGSKTNIVPQLNIYVAKKVLRHVDGELGAIKKVFEMTNNKLQVPLEINGKPVKLDGTNLSEFEKDKDVLHASLSYILSKSGNSYAKLLTFLKAPNEAIEEAKDVDKFNKIVEKIKSATTIDKYFAEIDKLQVALEKKGYENSPVEMNTFVSTIDSYNKLKNDEMYRKAYHNAMNGFLSDIKKEVEKQISTQIYIYKDSKTANGRAIYDNILKRVTPKFDKEGKKIVGIEFLKDERGNTILDYLDVKVKGQVPIIEANEKYTPTSLKGMINNKVVFSPFGNRGKNYELDDDKILTLIGVPTVATKVKREIKIDIKNDTSENLVKENRGRPKKSQQKEETKEEAAKNNSVDKVEQSAPNIPQDNSSSIKNDEKEEKPSVETEKASVSAPEVSEPASFEDVPPIEVSTKEAVEISSVEDIGVDLEELNDWLSDEAPSAGKAETPTVQAPNF